MLDVAFLQSKDVLVRFTGDYELALCYTAATVVADYNTNRSVVTVCNELFCKHSKLAAIFNVQFSSVTGQQLFFLIARRLTSYFHSIATEPLVL